MSSEDQARWRQLSWVTYGNAYLNGYAPFSSWHNHNGFEGITAEFRLFDGTLVAEDGFEWLWWLRQNGAQRLSMEHWDGLEDVGRFSNPDPQVIVCHYPNRDDIWARFDETSQAMLQARRSGNHEIYFGRNFHIADRFTLVASRKNLTDRPKVDWKRIDKDIRTRLLRFKDMDSLANMPRLNHGQWFYATGRTGDHLPTVPPTNSLWIAHKVLSGLASLRWQLDAAMHPKNESSAYYWPAPEVQARLDELSNTIDQLTEMVQCHAGTESAWRLTEHSIPLTESSRPNGSGYESTSLASSENTLSYGAGLTAFFMVSLVLVAAWNFPKVAAFLAISLITLRVFRR